MLKFKRFLSVLLILTIVLVGCSAPASNPPAPTESESPALAELPPAQKVEGDYSFENSGINHENLLDYLYREDSVYIDTRNYEDYSKKHFKNFEVIPFFAYIYNENAGTEGFPQLFKGTHEEPVAVYESSEAILNALFPKDKNLMIMCQSGGRVAMLMKMLEAYGYDMDKVYNIGGMAQYTAEQYRDLITDTEELNIEVNYIINAN
ncbi:MAG: hypothetical protein GX339_01185 [Tissierellia bacterium]|nr:hypothetical protein [Tissierellia bacterium]